MWVSASVTLYSCNSEPSITNLYDIISTDNTKWLGNRIYQNLYAHFGPLSYGIKSNKVWVTASATLQRCQRSPFSTIRYEIIRDTKTTIVGASLTQNKQLITPLYRGETYLTFNNGRSMANSVYAFEGVPYSLIGKQLFVFSRQSSRLGRRMKIHRKSRNHGVTEIIRF